LAFGCRDSETRYAAKTASASSRSMPVGPKVDAISALVLGVFVSTA
jgi:hypothetical protein